MAYLFTSDLHLGHKNIIHYSNRPFSDLEEMHNAIDSGWLERVRPEDVVFVLGDVSFWPRDRTQEFLRVLPGTKILIRGNHDRSPRVMSQLGFAAVLEELVIWEPDTKKYVFLSHKPTPAGIWKGRAELALCGHVHTDWITRLDGREGHQTINVGVDQWNFTPVTLRQMLDRVGLVDND